jgi:hypothetical protein
MSNILNGNTLTHKEIFQKQDTINFEYIGSPRQIILRRGTYLFECWGGGGPVPQGAGAYTRGTITLDSIRAFHIYAGQRGTLMPGNTNNRGGAGWNGGGNGVANSTLNGHESWGGSGATDIRLTGGAFNDLTSRRSRIMVAAGSGGGGRSNRGVDIIGAAGGGLNGISGGGGGGTQTAGGAGGSNGMAAQAGSFGQGSDGSRSHGGGGGYYGGGGADASGGGGSGSSFISGHTGCNAINATGVHTGQPNHFSGLRFISTLMIAGNASMPNPRGNNNLIGNGNNGFIRITVLETDNSYLNLIQIANTFRYYDEDNQRWRIILS